ncbi:MAG: hypothetical protein KKA62_03365 [Nanoarchaeota archaeon]|nr:hypothetical protein [Nanoarchaeota archaeon]MBU1976964.1 hypothetical protein [Nanoarchaeota archaeon]
MAKKEDSAIGGIIVAVCLILYYARNIARELFPFFFFVTILIFIVALVVLFTEADNIMKIGIIIGFFVMLFLTILSGFVGWEMEEVPIIKEALEIGENVDHAKQIENEAIEKFKNETIKIIDDLESDSTHEMKHAFEVAKLGVSLS